MDLMNIKILLNLQDDDSKDNILTILCTNAMQTLCVYLGITSLPRELNFVAEQLVITRYNRLGSEGIQTEKIDVLSTTYVYNNDELTPFYAILEKYKENNQKSKRLKLL